MLGLPATFHLISYLNHVYTLILTRVVSRDCLETIDRFVFHELYFFYNLQGAKISEVAEGHLKLDM